MLDADGKPNKSGTNDRNPVVYAPAADGMWRVEERQLLPGKQYSVSVVAVAQVHQELLHSAPSDPVMVHTSALSPLPEIRKDMKIGETSFALSWTDPSDCLLGDAQFKGVILKIDEAHYDGTAREETAVESSPEDALDLANHTFTKQGLKAGCFYNVHVEFNVANVEKSYPVKEPIHIQTVARPTPIEPEVFGEVDDTINLGWHHPTTFGIPIKAAVVSYRVTLEKEVNEAWVAEPSLTQEIPFSSEPEPWHLPYNAGCKIQGLEEKALYRVSVVALTDNDEVPESLAEHQVEVRLGGFVLGAYPIEAQDGDESSGLHTMTLHWSTPGDFESEGNVTNYDITVEEETKPGEWAAFQHKIIAAKILEPGAEPIATHELVVPHLKGGMNYQVYGIAVTDASKMTNQRSKVFKVTAPQKPDPPELKVHDLQCDNAVLVRLNAQKYGEAEVTKLELEMTEGGAPRLDDQGQPLASVLLSKDQHEWDMVPAPTPLSTVFVRARWLCDHYVGNSNWSEPLAVELPGLVATDFEATCFAVPRMEDQRQINDQIKVRWVPPKSERGHLTPCAVTLE